MFECACGDFREMYRALLESIPVRIFWKNTELQYLGCTTLFARDAGLNSADEIIGKIDSDLVWKEKADHYMVNDRKVLDSGVNVTERDESLVRQGGAKVWLSISRGPLRDQQGKIIGVLGCCQDITELVLTERILQKVQDEFDSRINKQAQELLLVQEKMENALKERMNTEIAMQQTDTALAREKANLEESNIALKILMKKRENDKLEIEEQVLANVRYLVNPFLEKLRNTGLNETQQIYADILTANLAEIVSSFARDQSVSNWRLTPTEIQVANFVKQGRTTKEIADVMNLSSKTIDVHRKNIRKKSGIRNKKINLRSVLLCSSENSLS